MMLRKVNLDRWKIPLIGTALLFLGMDLQRILPSPFHFLGMILVPLGVGVLQSRLLRSMGENLVRLMSGAAFFHLLGFLLTVPRAGELTALWVFLPAFAMGLLGFRTPHVVRKKILGFLLAAQWILLIGAVFDGAVNENANSLTGCFIAGLLLIWPTLIYSRWAKTGELPHWITEWYWKLPDDEPLPQAISASPAPELEIGKAPVHDPAVEVRTISS